MEGSLYVKHKRVSDCLLYGCIYMFTMVSLLVLCVIVLYVSFKASKRLDLSYLVSVNSVLKGTVGILPQIINTIYMVVLTLLIACPIAIGCAIYLNEYAINKRFVSMITFTSEVLAGIPSIIYGMFGMLFFGDVLGLGYSILTGALTLSIMILPIITRNTQVALESVNKSYREAALGMGASRFYMIKTVLLPSASRGILTGIILGIGRIVAESAALLFTAGSMALLPSNIFTHIFSSGGTLTIQLYLEMAKANYDYAFVIAFILIVIVFILNTITKLISRRIGGKDGYKA